MKCSICGKPKAMPTEADTNRICCQCEEGGSESKLATDDDNDPQLTDDQSESSDNFELLVEVEMEDEPIDEIENDYDGSYLQLEIKEEPGDIDIQEETTYDSLPFQSEEIEIKDEIYEITAEQPKPTVTVEYKKPVEIRDLLKCEICNISFSSKRMYVNHYKVNHMVDNTLYCKICQLNFTEDIVYKKHIEEKHEGFDNICIICLELFHTGKDKIIEHQCLGRQLFTCNTCKMCYGKKENLWNHMNEHNIPDECRESSFIESRIKAQVFTCVHCDDGKIYIERNVYCNHVENFHQGNFFRCDTCKKGFKTAYNRTKHMSKCKAVGPKIKVCPRCSQVFPNIRRLKYHTKTVHQKPEYVCGYCPKQFFSLTSLQAHLQSHRNERKFHCILCELSFNTRSTLARHNRTYHRSVDDGDSTDSGREGRFKCTVCGERFKFKLFLVSHTETHHSNQHVEPKYVCEECNIYFTSSSKLRFHLTQSFSHRPVMCRMCGVVFANAKKYDEHFLKNTCINVVD